MKPDLICRRYDALKSDRSQVEDVWRLLQRFVGPYRGDFYYTMEHTGEVDWRRREIYDSTAVDAAAALAANLAGSLVSPAAQWFDLRFRVTKKNRKDVAREWLEMAATTAYYALVNSNFNLEIDEVMLDLVILGTALLVEEYNVKDRRLEFSAVPVREGFFELDSQSRVLRFYRRLEWTCDQILDKFGEENVPKWVKEHVDEGKSPTTRHEVIFCIYRRPEYEKNPIDLTKPANPKLLPVGYKYILKKDRTELGDEGGYYEMPAFAVRWRTTAGSDWGNAPGMICLSNIMTLNQAYESTLESAEKMIEPPIMTTQMGIIGDMDMRRGGVTVVSDMDDIAPFPVGGDVNSGIIIVDDLRGQIRRTFFEDQLELKESPAMTATEVNVRYRLMERLLGPTLGRLQNDLLDPIISRTINILLRNGEIPPPPQEVYDGGEIDIEYTGPLPRSQKSDRAASILGWIGQMAAMAEVRPDVMDIPNLDNAFTEVATLTGVPATCVNNESEIRSIRKIRAEQLQRRQELEEQAAEAQALNQAAAGAKNLSALAPEGIAAMQESVEVR